MIKYTRSRQREMANQWLNQYNFLAIFGDMKPHTLQEIEWMGTYICNKKHLDYNLVFRKTLENSLVKREGRHIDPRADSYTLTEKGDEAFREWSIRLMPGKSGYFRNVDRRDVKSYMKYDDKPVGEYGQGLNADTLIKQGKI